MKLFVLVIDEPDRDRTRVRLFKNLEAAKKGLEEEVGGPVETEGDKFDSSFDEVPESFLEQNVHVSLHHQRVEDTEDLA